jgi:dTDP-4-dehydrorhamnose reductase
MKILITGANGMVARAAVRRCLAIGDTVFPMTRQRLDIADRDAVLKMLDEARPDAVLNCAAYTNVDGAESNEEAAYAANSTGVENLAVGCREVGSQFVTISTDYVFDGIKTGFYTEEDKPNPQSVYARSKLEGEQRAGAAYELSIIVRSGWIFGHGGTNFLSVMGKLLAEGKRVKAIGDSYGTPTYAEDLAIRLRELVGMDASGLYHVTNSGEGTSYLGFAEKVCEIGGFDKGLLEAVSFADLKRPAPRPVSSKLRSLYLGNYPLPPWDDGLRRHLAGQEPVRSK